MKIAFFNANLRVGQDGVTRCVYKMIDAAVSKGHKAIAITSTLPDGEPPVPMFKVPSVVLPLQKSYRLAYPRYSAFAPILESFKPDILHINSPCTLGFSAARYARHFGVPIVATYHTHFPTYPRYYKLQRFEALTWKLTRNLYNGVDRTFVPTRPILKELEAQNIQRLEFLPNGVDNRLFNPSKRSDQWRSDVGAENKPVLLFVSRLVWEKDLRVLADAYNRLHSKRDDFAMVVVGDGHARAEFESMMPGARFLGFRQGEELARCYASSDIFVFPSTTETFGLVTLEAMSSGLAPVAARVGGAVGLIEEGKTGLFSDPLNGGHMAAQVDRLLDDPSFLRVLGRNAHRHAQTYAWESVLDRLFESYANVIVTSRARRRSALRAA